MSGMQGEALRTAPIDSPIRVLVDALAHVPGVSTHASCGGHLLRDAHGTLDIALLASVVAELTPTSSDYGAGLS